MRLLDLVAQTTAARTLRDPRGKIISHDSVLQAAADLKECPVRYVLDRDAAAQCNDLVSSAPDLFDAADSFLRVPSEHFWLEWYGDPSDDRKEILVKDRMGALVTADPTGRNGELRLFWPEGDGAACTTGTIIFDLDQKLNIPSGSTELFKMTHRDLPHIDALLRHTALKLDPALVGPMSKWTMREKSDFLTWLAHACWFGLPIVLAFSAMMTSNGLMESRESDLSRLNKARASKRKAALLDHVEVSMRLGFSAAAGEGGHAFGERRTPRLHYVRGHMVRRSGKTFWRTSHLRGDPLGPMLNRTVNFSGAGRRTQRNARS